MTENDGLRRYVDAGTALTQITRARAEELVRELIKTGEVERHRAQEWVEDLVKAEPRAVRGPRRHRCAARCASSSRSSGSPTSTTWPRRWPTSWPGPPSARAARRRHRPAGQVARRPVEEGPEEERPRQDGRGQEGAARKAAADQEGGEEGSGEEGGRLTPTPVRRRLDTELVRRGLAGSRESARLLVEQGAVLVGGSPCRQAGPPRGRVRSRRRHRRRCAAASCRAAGTSSTPPWTASASTWPVVGASTPARRRAGSPTACSSRGAAWSSPSTSGTASSIRRLRARPPGRRCWSGPTSGPWTLATVGGAPSTWSWPTCRSSRCAPWPRCSPAPWPGPAPTSSCW